jgi:GEVED domain/HYR domain/SprB repeat/Domain of unknown function DUF11
MPRHLHYTLVSLFVLMLSPFNKNYACGFDYVGSCGNFVRFNANNILKEYTGTACGYGTPLQGSSIGTGLTTLKISSVTSVSWESCTNMLKESNVYYRVFSSATNKGLFTKLTTSAQSVNNAPPYRTRTWGSSPDVDLLSGLLPNTTYTIEFYFQLRIDNNGDNIIDDSKIADNAGAYYAATFQTGNIVVNTGFPVTITTQNVSCNGGSNGSATASASGGTVPYTYAWSGGGTGASKSNLASGSYSVTATDATGATGIKSFNITEPAPLTVNLTPTPPNCLQTNGAISATVNGGTPTYTLLWSNSATTASISSLASGIFSITVTDSKNCTASASTVLTENCGGGGSYCASTSGNPWGSWISKVQYNTINNTSDKVREDRYAIGYSDWKDKATTAAQGSNTPLSITPTLSWSGAQTALYYRVWIDFNGNGLFEASELAFERNAIGLAGVTSPVNVPLTAKLGSTVMRVSMKEGAYPTACEAFAAGEVEDYTIVITAGTTNPCLTDNVPPVLSPCPANQSLTTTTTCATATWTAPTATDNCTATPSVTGTRTSGFCFPIGTNTVTYTATDARNNSATCSFSVVVTANNTCTTDNIPPVLSPCPANQSLTTATTCAAATWTAPTATDNCTATPSVIGTRASGFCFPIGTNTVSYTATDARNNSATCSFNVVVTANSGCTTDNIPPVLSPCPANQNLVTSTTCAAATWTAPTATDNCTATPSVVGTRASGFCFPIGTNTVTYTATDARNNSATCSFSVIVSSSTGASDIGVTIASSATTYTRFSNITFTITAKNNAATAFSNVVVEFKFPTATVTGGTATPSVGLWQEWCNGTQCYEWQIPSLAANSTATLTVPLFVLSPTGTMVATTKLLNSTPVDGNVANNSATINVAPPTSAPLQTTRNDAPTQLIPLVVQQVVPNPTVGDMEIWVESLIKKEVQFNFSNVVGQVMHSEMRSIEKGANRVGFDCSKLPQGVYFIQTDIGTGKNAPIRFVRL